MSQDDYKIIISRYEAYCHAFISIADQVKHLEEVHGLDLHVTKDRMWCFLNQIVEDRPDWSR